MPYDTVALTIPFLFVQDILEMKRRMLHVNWQALEGACKKKKILKLRPNVNGVYECPVENCLHDDFLSQRGLRKHINNVHTWYYYFDSRPSVARKKLSSTDLVIQPANFTDAQFSIEKGVGFDFVSWLQNTGGGDKALPEAKKIAKRAMLFLQSTMIDECEETLTISYVDCCIGSPDIILNFFKEMEESWKFSSTSCVSYVRAIQLLMDFRKSTGVSDASLRSFVAAEVYLKRAKVNFSRRKRNEHRRNLPVE